MLDSRLRWHRVESESGVIDVMSYFSFTIIIHSSEHTVNQTYNRSKLNQHPSSVHKQRALKEV
jgi:hypothetical protein